VCDVNRLKRVTLEILRLTFARDSLPLPPPAGVADPSGPRLPANRLLHAIFSLERLETEPVAPRASAHWGGNLLHAIFAPETLPSDPPAPPRERRSILRWLLAPEALPLDPEPPPRARRSRLAALFAPEKLDDSP
jgi:hypothetical protein